MNHRPLSRRPCRDRRRPVADPGAAHGRGARTRIDYLYKTIDLDALASRRNGSASCSSWARTLGFDALNITHPCKRLVMEHLDDIDELAASVGAVNTVLFTDGPRTSATTPTPRVSRIGFAEGLPDAPTDRRHDRCGRRGGGVGDCAPSARHRPPMIVDLDTDRATGLAHDLASRHPRRGSPHRLPTSCRSCCPPCDGSCTAPRPVWPNTPACRLTPTYCIRGSGWPTSSTGRWIPHFCRPHANSAAAPSTVATWPCIRPPRPFS